MAASRVVVIGAGIGGLVAALELARRGREVTVLERAVHLGGKIRQLDVAGAPIDSGPTVFTMRWIFEQIFADAGTRLDAELRLSALDVLARHAWDDGARLDLFADVARSADAVGSFAGGAEARRFTEFCAEARAVYQALEGPHIRSQRPDMIEITRRLGLAGTGTLVKLGPFATLWRALGRRLKDPRLRQLFGRYATYCGSSPLAAPATLLLVAHVEMDGVWSVDGGMHAIPLAVAALAERHGAAVRTGAHCTEIRCQGGRVSAVRLESGEVIEADAVVFNGDINALATGLLGGEASGAVGGVTLSQRSLSALAWSMNARADGFPLTRHTVFFNSNYEQEFRDIFQDRRLPRDPTVYVCAQDRADDATAPGGPERLLMIVNAPALGDTGVPVPAEIEQCADRAFARLARAGLSVERTAENHVLTTPVGFNALFPGTGGALYGRAAHSWLDTFRRPHARTGLPGLYVAGGSAHPGPGVPMAAMSGRLAAQALLED
ncbi:MAG: phytoene desaturase [Gammaproteobacteria bacterium]|nr:phytoene desaturase [Gammaproteobacteria bacterium]